MRVTYRLRILSLALTAAIVALSVTTFTGKPVFVEANGRIIEYQSELVGHYQVLLGTVPDTPLVGPTHLTIRIKDVRTALFKIASVVLVTGTGPNSDVIELGPLNAKRDSIDPSYHDLSLVFDRPGLWTITVLFEDDESAQSANFLINVRKSNPVQGILTLIGVMAFLGVLGLSGRVYLKERKRGKNKKPSR